MWTIISNAIAIFAFIFWLLADYHIGKQNELLSEQNAKLKDQYNQNVKELNGVIEQNKVLRSSFKSIEEEMKKYYEAVWVKK